MFPRDGHGIVFEHGANNIFRFQRPVMTDFSPRIGPKSGGTLIAVQGRNLDIGSRLNITVGYLPCFPVK